MKDVQHLNFHSYPQFDKLYVRVQLSAYSSEGIHFTPKKKSVFSSYLLTEVVVHILDVNADIFF